MTFEEIYQKQKEFEDFIIKKSPDWPDKKLEEFNNEERVAYSKEMALYEYQEIAEFINAVGNYRMHKFTKDKSKVKDIKEEIADNFIYILNFALTHKMTAQELLDAVHKKQKKNFARQEKGY